MSPRKLSDADKKDILQQYRQSEATTSTLASEYGVSSSTISRFLKNNLAETEYEHLIHLKRLARTNKKERQLTLDSDRTETESTQPQRSPDLSDRTDEPKFKSTQAEENIPLSQQLVLASSSQKTKPTKPKLNAEVDIESQRAIASNDEDISPIEEELDELNTSVLEEMLGEDIDDLDEDEELEEGDEDDWELEEKTRYTITPSQKVNVKILPLSEASFPRTCYLVVDRSSELITRPLEDFADLGKIPSTEFQQKTLPVFDNHRVARRFSHRREKVIKVPDGRMLQKTSSHLEAKGITRLLIDGQVYSVAAR